MADIIDTLHPKDNLDDNIYPNIKSENIPAGAISMEKLDENLSNKIGVNWDFNPGDAPISTDMINHIFEIKGFIKLIATAGDSSGEVQTITHTLCNCIFQITNVKRTGHTSSQGPMTVTITYNVILSKRDSSGGSGWDGPYTFTASGVGYGYGNAKYEYQGILTKIY